MKRASTKKVKAHPAIADANDALEEHFKPVGPQVKPRVRSSATMIGLAISMGASSLLLTRQSDRALAAEPVGNEPTVSTVPAATEAALGGSINSVELKALVKSVPVGASSFAVVLPTPWVQPKLAAVPKPAPPVVKHQVQKRRTLRRQFSQNHQVDAATIAPSKSLPKLTECQAEKVLKNPRPNELIQKLKASKTVETRCESYKVNSSKITPPAATTASQQLTLDKSPRVTGEVNGDLKAQQKAELNNRLKQKPNRLKDSLAQFRSEESNNSSAPATKLASASSVVEKTQSTNAASLAPPVMGSTVGQQAQERSPLFAPSFEGAVLDVQMSQLRPDAAIVVSLEQKIAVNEPTVVVPSVATDYQVKAGDTLSAIASDHGISLSELIKANKLTDPDRLQINQRLIIPAFQYSSAVAQSASESIPYNRAGGSQQESASVPPQPPAATPPPGAVPNGIGGSIWDETDQLSPPTFDETQLSGATAVPNGIGGSISDETAELSPPTFDKTQLAQSPVTKSEELQFNHYVQNLRTDIQRLRQKYYAQQRVSQDVPVVSETAPVAHKPAIQKWRPTLARSPVPATTRTSVAEAPSQGDASQSLESPRIRQVSPQLPPLGGVDTYLPKASSAPSKNYVWPTKGVLTSGYGWRWGRMHKGIDIAAPIGTPIVASAPGVVVRAGWNSGGYGNLVELRHPDGTLTRYAHNKRVLVQAGQPIEQGQLIAEMGSTGRSTGPHSHFEIHLAGKGAVNPIAFLPR